jgi:hypothetical protein
VGKQFWREAESRTPLLEWAAQGVVKASGIQKIQELEVQLSVVAWAVSLEKAMDISGEIGEEKRESLLAYLQSIGLGGMDVRVSWKLIANNCKEEYKSVHGLKRG